MSKHVELSPSSASRWMNCPGSVALSRGLPDRESDAAREGTFAHSVAEAMLNGEALPEGVTLELRQYVSVFVEYCMSRVTPKSVWASEQWLSLAGLNPPDEMGGTTDFVCWNPDILDIADYKHGTGVFVDVEDNPQLLYYAVMALLWCEREKLRIPPRVRIAIVQPRVEYADPVRWVEYTLDEVLAFMSKLLHAAERVVSLPVTQLHDETIVPADSLNVGKWCRWCKVLASCPAQRVMAGEIARMEFSVVTPDVLPSASLLTNDELGSILARARYLAQWVKSIEEEVTSRLGKSQEIPGWKLVPTKGRRKWISDQQAILQALGAVGVPPDAVLENKLLGITDVERLLKTKKVPMPAGITTNESAGFTLTPETDSRPSRNEIAANEFTVVSSTSSTE